MRQLITSLQNPLVKHLVKLRGDSDYRYEQRMLLLEGSKPIKEVLPHVKTLIYSETFIPFSVKDQVEWVVSDAVLKKISGLTSPEGVIAEVQMPEMSSLKGCRDVLVLDGISDPGNMGTLMRTALAFGWDGLYFLPNCCDLFNEKVLRAARGAHFKIPLRVGTAKELKELIDQQELEALYADIEGPSPEKVKPAKRRLLIMGNEAHGASLDVRSFSTPISIPMAGEMESLNVAIAGGILLYLLKSKN